MEVVKRFGMWCLVDVETGVIMEEGILDKNEAQRCQAEMEAKAAKAIQTMAARLVGGRRLA